jgi:hypothetical protein
VLSINAAEAATIIAFIAVLHSGAPPFGEHHGHENGIGFFCPGFAEAVANIAIYCKQRFAACNPRAVNENRRHVGK